MCEGRGVVLDQMSAQGNVIDCPDCSGKGFTYEVEYHDSELPFNDL